jgi:uncharacterized membrane protein
MTTKTPLVSLRHLRLLAITSLLLLAALCVATELWLNPLRPGGSWLALKALPLLSSLRGFVHARRRSYQWMSLLVWLYFMEGAVRAASDAQPVWGYLQAAIALTLFACSAAYARFSVGAGSPARTGNVTSGFDQG